MQTLDQKLAKAADKMWQNSYRAEELDAKIIELSKKFSMLLSRLSVLADNVENVQLRLAAMNEKLSKTLLTPCSQPAKNRVKKLTKPTPRYARNV